MIVKALCRSGGAQLAAYQLRPGENAVVLQLDDPSDDLHTAFTQWDAIGELTRAEKRLIHCQISPDNRYEVTPDQYRRMAEILAEEYGVAHHPRAVVFHGEGKNPHIHVTIQRTDPNTLKAWDDSFNYVLNERASLRMAKEFGHEIVPGKHAKRDREKQPDFPRAEMSRAEAQLAKRTGKDLKKMKAELAAMKAAAESAQAFKAAVENAGFILANGERGYTLVDEGGAAYNLARQLKVKVDAVNEYMKPIPLASLPSAEQAQARQAERRAVSKSDARKEAGKQAPEQGKLEQPQVAPKAPEGSQTAQKSEKKPRTIDPVVKAQITSLRAWSDGAKAFKNALQEAGYTLARGQTGYCVVSDTDVFSLVRYAGTTKAKLDALLSPIPLDTLPTVKEVVAAQREAQKRPQKTPVQKLPVAPDPLTQSTTSDIDLGTRMELSALNMAAEAIAEAQKRASPDPELEALEKAITKRHEEDTAKLRDSHEYELRAKEVEMDREIVRRLADYTAIQDQQAEAFLKDRKEYRTGIWGIIDAINSRWNPTQAAEKTQAREKERQNFYRRLAKERTDYEALLQQTKALEIENLIERQSLQRHDLDTRTAEDKERHISEHHEAKRIAAEMEHERLQQEELEHEDSLREGQPPPGLGKP